MGQAINLFYFFGQQLKTSGLFCNRVIYVYNTVAIVYVRVLEVNVEDLNDFVTIFRNDGLVCCNNFTICVVKVFLEQARIAIGEGIHAA